MAGRFREFTAAQVRAERASRAINGAVGKRLTYRWAD